MGERVAKAECGNDADLAERLRSELGRFDNQTTLLLRDLKGERRPQVNDLVRGEIVLERGESSVWIRLFGKVLGNEDCSNVRVRFDHFEYEDDDGRDWDKQAARYLKKDFQVHAAEMEWNDDDEWSFDLSI